MEEIRFFLTRKDFWHFRLYVIFRRRSIFILLFLFLFVIAFFFIIMQSMPLAQSILLSLLFVLLIIAIFVFRLWRSASKAAQGTRKRGANIINISSEGFRQRNDLSDSTTSWRTIKAIQQDKYNFYLILDNPGSNVLMAFLIPRHAFASPEEAESFIGRARGYWSEQVGQIATNH
jgi:ABC-type multidrug transport system fused ATPase/permease subunit